MLNLSRPIKVALYVRMNRSDSLADQAGPMWKRAAAQGWDAKLFVEKESTTRPVKEELLKRLKNREFDGVCVYALDRWARSVGEIALEFEEFKERGITFHSIREGFNFDAATGLANMAKVFRQLERDLNKERTFLGLATARASGRILGRHPRGCGCGTVTSSGRVHNGAVKPIRDDEGTIVSWDAPEGVQVRMRPRNQGSSVEAGVASP